jgi:hypothetical protein
MITNKGKDIIAKFMIGQAPAYASYIAFGCGPEALANTDDLADYAIDNDFANKQSLDMEMFRTQVTSRGYVTDLVYNPTTLEYEEVSKIVFTAELPSEQTYRITELGLFPAKTNPVAANKDSRMIYDFGDTEKWEYHTENSISGLQTYTVPLYGESDDGAIKLEGTTVPFRTNSNNSIFEDSIRLNMQEPGRYLNRVILLPSDLSYIEGETEETLEVKSTDASGYYGSHVHLTGTSIDLSQNSPEDELKLAFSIIGKDSREIDSFSKVKLIFELSSDDTSSSTNKIRFNVLISADTIQNRYKVITKKLSELTSSALFSWGNATVAKIYASVFVDDGGDDVLSDQYYVALDAFRIENVTATNPIYGMTGYTIVKNSNSTNLPIVKNANTSNLVEFRFGLDVV